MKLQLTKTTSLIVFLTFPFVVCKTPEYIKICSKSKNLSQCLVENFHAVVKHLSHNGDAAFKLQDVTKIHVAEAPLQISKELHITLIDMDFYNLDKWDVTEFTMSDTEIRMRGFIPSYWYVGKYDMKGRILILPISGQGTMNMTHTDMTIDYKAKLKIQERKGKKYFHVENNWADTHATLQNTKRVHFNFDNLFNGDPRLGPEMNIFLNDNWKDVFNEAKLGIEQFLTFGLINPFVNGYLRHIPIDELFTN